MLCNVFHVARCCSTSQHNFWLLQATQHCCQDLWCSRKGQACFFFAVCVLRRGSKETLTASGSCPKPLLSVGGQLSLGCLLTACLAELPGINTGAKGFNPRLTIRERPSSATVTLSHFQQRSWTVVVPVPGHCPARAWMPVPGSAGRLAGVGWSDTG